MAQWVKALAVKPNNLTWILWKERASSRKLTSDFHMFTVATWKGQNP